VEIVFLLFAVISVLLIVDGSALQRQKRIQPLLKQFKLGKDERKTRLIAQFMQIAGAITLIWTVIAFFLYDLLIIPIFIIIYILLLVLIGGMLTVIWRKKF